jgi:hypothetical protein
MKKVISPAVLFFVSFTSVHAADDAALVAARQKLVSLTRMREALASTLKSKTKQQIDEGVFKQVCVPVGKEFKSWAQLKGYSARQISSKNRNPDHAPLEHEASVYAEFEGNPKLEEKVLPAEREGRPGRYLYRRIPVATSCLHCHGVQGERPDFIVKKYPADKAYGFKVGDLRGLYSVYLPN